MKIVSLLPSTTEIISALGLERSLIGRSHECNQSGYIRSLPAITSPQIKSKESSRNIHSEVQNLIKNGLSVFTVNGDALSKLKPDLVLTQDHCEVCAASLNEVEKAVQTHCSTDTIVISVSPESVEDILKSFLKIGKAVQAEKTAMKLVEDLKMRFDIISQTINGATRKEIITIEWLDPLMTGGNWIPELVNIAGAESLLTEAGKHSPVIQWEHILNADPEKLFIMPCGYSIDQTKKEMPRLADKNGWNDLKAVKNSEVYLLDGDRFFNRSGPGIYDSARILAEINHPKLFKPLYKNDGWIRWISA